MGNCIKGLQKALKNQQGSEKLPEDGGKAAAGGNKGNQEREESGERPFDKYRKQASEHAEKRGEYMRQSQEAWNNGDKGEAKRLSELGKAEGAKVDAANAKAVEVIFENQDLKSGSIDLHGLHVQEALDAVENYLKLDFGNKNVVEIITGAGNHSAGGHSKVKAETHALLKKKGLKFVETTHGSIDVTLGNRSN